MSSFARGVVFVLLFALAALAPPVTAFAEPVVMVSGVLSSNIGPIDSGSVYAQRDDGSYAYTEIGSGGSYSLELEPGVYDIGFSASSSTRGALSYVMDAVEVTTAPEQTLDLALPEVPLAVRVERPDGTPVRADVSLRCLLEDTDEFGDPSTVRSMRSTGSGAAATLWGFEVDVENSSGCVLSTSTGGYQDTRPVALDPDVTNEVAVLVPADLVMVSGIVETNIGPIERGSAEVLDPDAEGESGNVRVAADGSYSLGVIRGTHDLSFHVRTAGPGASGDAEAHLPDQQVTEDRQVDVDLTGSPLTVTVDDSSGTPPAASADLVCTEYDENGEVRRSSSFHDYSGGHGTLSVWGVEVGDQNGSGCRLTVGLLNDGWTEYRDLTPADMAAGELTVVIPPRVSVSGTVTLPGGEDVHRFLLQAFRANGELAIQSRVLVENGMYEVQLAPGTYDVHLVASDIGENLRLHRVFPGTVVSTEQVSLEAELDAVPVTVHFVDEYGNPTRGSARLECPLDDSEEYVGELVSQGYGGADPVTLWGIPTTGRATCHVASSRVGIPGTDAELTIVAPTGAVIEGPPTASIDGDGVPDVVESLGPNNGDGNNDGTPDQQQANVTSLPSLGGVLGDGSPYLTLGSPEGTTLADVTTLDPSDPGQVTTPPPAGYTLPAGLASFVIQGVVQGSTHTVTIHPPSTDGVNGYAKYDPDTETWTAMPADRVRVFETHVEVDLTDGGIGDQDGLADGRITDPGGIAILEQSDTDPPVVTGAPTTQPNADGWFTGAVTIDWTATDEGSGLAGQPANTVVTGEGADLTAQSATVCDLAATPNCTQGVLTGLKIDRTAPVVSLTGVQDGGRYTLGATPTPGCSATDALSGVAGPCQVQSAGGNANGVGEFTYTASATDRAGNTRTVTGTYRVVYEFVGFLQPVNDPSWAPWHPLSVVKSGVTVPFRFLLTRADGRPVIPVSKPVWLTPSRGASTAAKVNEELSSSPGTIGTEFRWTGQWWEYKWSTKNVRRGFRYLLGVRLDDGTTHDVTVAVR